MWVTAWLVQASVHATLCATVLPALVQDLLMGMGARSQAQVQAAQGAGAVAALAVQALQQGLCDCIFGDDTSDPRIVRLALQVLEQLWRCGVQCSAVQELCLHHLTAVQRQCKFHMSSGQILMYWVLNDHSTRPAAVLGTACMAP